jgi:hypothetical protein
LEISETIKYEDFNKWLELFNACNGRFVYNPVPLFGRSVMVVYKFEYPDDYKLFCEGRDRLSLNIVEKKRGFFGKLKAKLGL